MQVFVLGAIFSFLCGAIPTSYLIGRWVGRFDIRTKGSGNVGATNVNRTLGAKWGLFVLLFDALKGVVAVLLLSRLCTQNEIPLLVQQTLYGGIAVMGHIWTPFLKLKGGKGVATSLGVFLILAPLAMGISALLFVVLVTLTRYISVGSVLGAMTLPLWVYLLNYPKIVFIVSAIIAAIVVRKHKDNLRRLTLGEENRFSL